MISTISLRHLDISDKEQAFNAKIREQNDKIQKLQKELAEERRYQNISMMGMRVNQTLEELSLGLKDDYKNELNFEEKRKLEKMEPSEAG